MEGKREERKTKNDVTELDVERGLQQVEGESWRSWWMAPLDVRTCLGRQRTKKKPFCSNDCSDNCWFSDSCDEYFIYSGICEVPESFTTGNVLVGESTRSICRNLCSKIYDNQCSSFLYNRTDRSCILSTYTGEWLPRSTAPDHFNCSSENSKVEFYRRKRCLSKEL